MLANLEKYSIMMITAQMSWVPMYIQVNFSVIQIFHLPISKFAASGSTMHQITKPHIIKDDKILTTGLNLKKIPRFMLPILVQAQLTLIQRHFFKCSSDTAGSMFAKSLPANCVPLSLSGMFYKACASKIILAPNFVTKNSLKRKNNNIYMRIIFR